MSKGITICLIIVGLINFIPVAGILSAQRLEGAYGIALSSNDMIILMRHRALLFGVLGGFILFSAFASSYQGAAMIMAGISMVGFAVLVHSVGGFNVSINKVLIVDYVGIVFLVAAAFLKYGLGRS
jgi:uncharacterized membrane protein